MAIAVLFNEQGNPAYSDPPDNEYPFTAYYVDASASASPGQVGSNETTETFTHSVFVEAALVTWNPVAANISDNLEWAYSMGEFPFHYASMVFDSNTNAGDWLDMVKQRARGLLGDVIVDNKAYQGFPLYQEFIDEISTWPEIVKAAPLVYSYGLIYFQETEQTGGQHHVPKRTGIWRD